MGVQGECKGPRLLGKHTCSGDCLVPLALGLIHFSSLQMGAQGLGRCLGRETLGPQPRRAVALGSLRSGHGRMETTCWLGKQPWAPFQDLLPSPIKVSRVATQPLHHIGPAASHLVVPQVCLPSPPAPCDACPHGLQASSRRSVCPPSARKAASYGCPWNRALAHRGPPQPVRVAGLGPLPAHRPGRVSRSSSTESCPSP